MDTLYSKNKDRYIDTWNNSIYNFCLNKKREFYKSKIIEISQSDIFWKNILLDNNFLPYLIQSGNSELIQAVFINNKDKFKQLENTQSGREKLLYFYMSLLRGDNGESCASILKNFKESGMNLNLPFFNFYKYGSAYDGNLLTNLLEILTETQMYYHDKNHKADDKKIAILSENLNFLFSNNFNMKDASKIGTKDDNSNVNMVFKLENDELLDVCLKQIKKEKIGVLKFINKDLFSVLKDSLFFIEKNRGRKLIKYLMNFSSKEDNQEFLNYLSKDKVGLVGLSESLSIYKEEMLRKEVMDKFDENGTDVPAKKIKFPL